MTTSGDDSSTARRRPAILLILTLTALAAIAVVAALVLIDRNAASRDVVAGGDATTAGATSVDPTAEKAGASGTVSCSSGATGPLREDTRFTAASGATVPFSISLPADYYRACRAYPVLYVLHGKNQNHVDFMDAALRMRRAMDAGALDQAIIVTPDSFSTGRWENGLYCRFRGLGSAKQRACVGGGVAAVGLALLTGPPLGVKGASHRCATAYGRP